MIGLFLNNAVDLAREKFQNPNIALFPETIFDHPDLPGVGPVGGALDYISSAVYQEMDVTLFGNQCLPSTPHFIVIVAKKDSTFTTIGAQAQLLAQLLTIDYHDK